MKNKMENTTRTIISLNTEIFKIVEIDEDNNKLELSIPSISVNDRIREKINEIVNDSDLSSNGKNILFDSLYQAVADSYTIDFLFENIRSKNLNI